MTQQQALTILKSGKNVFLAGEPGAGKSYTVNLFTTWLKENRLRYAVVAPTGIAATHVGGTTIHSFTGNFNLSISRTEMDDEEIKKIAIPSNPQYDESFTVTRIKYVKVIIIDEISMVSALMLHNLDSILRYYCDQNKPFGGKQIVLVGDFFQLPPIVDDEIEDPHPLSVKLAYDAPQWKEAKFYECYLEEQHRQSEPVFIDLLRRMRDGKIEDKHRKILLKTSSNQHKIPPTELYPTNREADRRNTEEYERLTTEERVFEMRAEGNPVAIKQLKKGCLSPEILPLKVGTVVMLTRNAYQQSLDPNEPPVMLYANGEIGEVESFDDAGLPVVETADGKLIHPILAQWSDEHDGKINKDKISRIYQVPLKHAWAITIHKSQGMSLSAAKIDLRRSFAYGMGYVAVSRVRSLDGLAVLGMKKDALDVDPIIQAKDKEFREASKRNETL